MKRIVLIILILALIFSLVSSCMQQTAAPEISEQPLEQTPTTPIPEDDSNYTGNDFEYIDNGDGTCTITGYKEKLKGDLNIPSEINGLIVSIIGDKAFWKCSGFTEITIPDSVEAIGYMPFSGCSRVTSIEVSEQNKNYSSLDGILFNKDRSELITIPEGMQRENYIIPSSVTSIGEWAFYCTEFTGSLMIPESVENIGRNAFSVATQLTSIEVSERNPAYSSLDGILFNKNKSELICAPSGMKKENYVIPDTVTNIGESAFWFCREFKGNLTIPSSVTSIGTAAFRVCDGFTGNLTIPNSVINIEAFAFYACDGFTGSLIIPNSVTTIGESAFSSCDGLTQAEFLGDAPETFGDKAFGYQHNNFKKIIYDPAKEGWSTPEWNGYPAYPKSN